MQKNGKKKVPTINKPYMKGNYTDSLSLNRAVKFMSLYIISAFVYFVFGSIMLSDNATLRLFMSLMFVLVFLALHYMNGVNAGYTDITFAEIVYRRNAEGKTIVEGDRRKCYHPLKGYVSGLIGAAPFVILGLILAVLAQPQVFERSVLPSWISVLERREEIGGALEIYHQSYNYGLEDIVRIAVRLLITPFITFVGTDNLENLLLVERLSALILLLPMFAYGFGYTRGRQARSQVHMGIAANKKRQRKQAKKRAAQRTQRKPEALN